MLVGYNTDCEACITAIEDAFRGIKSYSRVDDDDVMQSYMLYIWLVRTVQR